MRKKKHFCNTIMPSEGNKISEINQYQKSGIAQFIIYADLEFLIEKIDGCKNNTGNSSITKSRQIFHQVIQFLQYRHLRA